MSVPVLGAQLETPLGNRDRWCVPERVYHMPIWWDEVDTTPGVYKLPVHVIENIRRLDDKLGHSNYQVILGTRCCPAFYRQVQDKRNSPPKPEHYIAYARFIETMCFAFQPWGIEVWNEPEFTLAESAGYEAYFGGWGNDGAGYGRMVRIA